jgi:hypothetical protein
MIKIRKIRREIQGRKNVVREVYFFYFSAALNGVFGSVGNTSVTLPTPNAAGGT